MTPLPISDPAILRRLLERTESGQGSEATFHHVDPESLALFTACELTGDERQRVIEHLAHCVECRQTASHLVAMERESENLETTRRLPRAWGIRWRGVAVALAACLLLAVGLVIVPFGRENYQVAEARVYNAARSHLERGDFTDAEASILEANRQGVKSDRLQSLRSQAIREIPMAVALDYAGRLTQFGYEPGGVITKSLSLPPGSKGADQALEILRQAASEELELVLNRGHALLASGEAAPALGEFSQAAELAPDNSNAWLGRGMAAFMLDDFAAADEYFRHALQLDRGNVAVEINLALTAEELGQRDEAKRIWSGLLEKPLSMDDRELAERALKMLKLAP